MLREKMEQRDIIIAAFCCGGKMSCKKEAQKFANPPITINVPGGSIDGFVKTAAKYKEKSSILTNLLFSKLPKNITPKRIALISFSDGWSFSNQIIKAKKDIERIDCIVVMDGIHTNGIQPWKNYAKLAANGDAKLWMAHTQFKPDSLPSAKSTNTKIIKSIKQSKTNIQIPDLIKNPIISKPIKVYSNAVKPHHKIFMHDTLTEMNVKGNVVRCEYEGNMPQDQTYNAQYVQPRFWQWLRMRWATEFGVYY